MEPVKKFNNEKLRPATGSFDRSVGEPVIKQSYSNKGIENKTLDAKKQSTAQTGLSAVTYIKHNNGINKGISKHASEIDKFLIKLSDEQKKSLMKKVRIKKSNFSEKGN